MQNETTKKDITAVLAEVASEVVGQLELSELLKRIINIAMKTLNAEVCSIFLKKENDPDTIECVAGSGFAEILVKIPDTNAPAEYKRGEGFTGTVFESGRIFNIKNRQELEDVKKGNWIGKYDKYQWAGEENKYRNGIALPLKIKGETIGVIKVENKISGDFFTEEDQIIFEAIANVIGVLTIQNAILHKKK